MRLILSLFTLALLVSPAWSHGYGQQQQFFQKQQQFAAPAYVPVQQQFFQKQTIVRQQAFAAPAYAPVQAAPAFCAPVQAAPIYAAPVAAPVVYGQQQFAPGKSRGFLPGRGLFGGRSQNTFRQRTFFRGNGAGAGVQAQFGAY